MSSFNLTAEINLRGPSNLSKIAGDIRRELSSIKTDLNLKISGQSVKSIDGVTTSIRKLNDAIIQTQANAANLSSVLGGLGQSTQIISSGSSNASKGMFELSSATSSASKQIAAASSEMADFGRQSALAIRRFAAFSIPTGLIYGLARAFSSAFKEFVDFDRQIVKLQQTTGGFKTDIEGINSEVRRLAVSFGVSSKDLIEASVTLAQAGLSANETKDALEALAKSALAPSFDSITETTEGAIAAFRQFSIQTRELEGVLGSINAVAAAFAVESSDIISAIQRTGGVFATASKGVSEGSDALNEFIAVFTSIRATTRESAETIATGLRTIFTRIQRGSTIEALKDFGIELTNAENKFVGAYEAVRRLSEGLSRLDPRSGEFAAIAEELGGFRQIGKVIPLIQQFATTQEALAIAQRGQGSLAQSAIQAQSALGVQFSKTREEFLAFVEALGKNKTFQNLISLGLSLTSTLIKVASSFKPLLPYLAIMGGIKAASGVTQFAGGFLGGLRKAPEKTENRSDNLLETLLGAAKNKERTDTNINSKLEAILSENTTALTNVTAAIRSLESTMNNRPTTMNKGGKVMAFAGGGFVPGSGNRDTVPAMLMPGEFVIRKKAVETLGAGNLQKMNKYASGGKVQRFAWGGKVSKLAELYPSIENAFGYDDVKNQIINDQSTDEEILVSSLSKKDKNIWKQSASLESWEKFEKLLTRTKNVGQPARGRWALLDFPETRSEAKFMKKGAIYNDTDSLKGNNDRTIAAKNYLFEQSVIKNKGNKGNFKAEELEPINSLPPAKVYWADPKEFAAQGLYNQGGLIQKFMAGGAAESYYGQAEVDAAKAAQKEYKRAVEEAFSMENIYFDILEGKSIGEGVIPEVYGTGIGKLKRGEPGVIGTKRISFTKTEMGGDTVSSTVKDTRALKGAALAAREAEMKAYTDAENSITAFKKSGLLENIDSGILSYIQDTVLNLKSSALDPDLIESLGSKLTRPNMQAFQSMMGGQRVEVQGQRTKLSEIFNSILETYGSGDTSVKELDNIITATSKKLFSGGFVQKFEKAGEVESTPEIQDIFDKINRVGGAGRAKQLVGLPSIEEAVASVVTTGKKPRPRNIFDKDFIQKPDAIPFIPTISELLDKAVLAYSQSTAADFELTPEEMSSAIDVAVAGFKTDMKDLSTYYRKRKGVPLRVHTGTISPDKYPIIERLLNEQHMAQVRAAQELSPGENISPLSKESRIKFGEPNLGGYNLEAILGLLGSGNGKKTTQDAIDFADGLTPAAASLFGVPAGIPTQAKLNVSSGNVTDSLDGIIRTLPKFAKGGMLTQAMAASETDEGRAIQKYKQLLASILPPEFLTETGFLKTPGGQAESISIIPPLSKQSTLIDKLLGISESEKTGASYSGGLQYKLIRKNLEDAKDSLPEKEYEALTRFLDQNLLFQGSEDTIDLSEQRRAGSLAHEGFHDIQGYLLDYYPEIYRRLEQNIESQQKNIEAWYADPKTAQWRTSKDYQLKHLFPETVVDSPYSDVVLQNAIKSTKKQTKQPLMSEDFWTKIYGESLKDFGRAEVIPVLMAAAAENDGGAKQILGNIFAASGLNQNFASILPRFAEGGMATLDKKTKEFGKIGLRNSGSDITATYFKNANRSGMVTAKKFADNLYTVGLSQATGGYGPRLYDVVMEAATSAGAMLTSDRNMVSGSAKAIWDYYFNNRNDVKKTALDPSQWTKNQAMIDPKLYGPKESWPSFDDPAWVLQSGYSKTADLINSSDVINMNDPKYADLIKQQQLEFLSRRSGGSIRKFAKGGSSQDTVPALLTPGEFVINKKAAQKIGYGQLHKLNHADKLQGFNKGGSVGSVKRFAAGGPAGGTSYKPEDFFSMINYSDVTGVSAVISANGEKYAKALADAANALGDLKPIEDLVKILQDKLKQQLQDIGMQPSQFASSQSWAMWDIGKQLHLNKNPQESSSKYILGNPLEDTKLQQEMVDRMAGWEIGKATGNMASSSWRLTEVGREARMGDSTTPGTSAPNTISATEVAALEQARAKFVDISSAVGKSLNSLSSEIKDTIVKTAVSSRKILEQEQRQLSAYLRIAKETKTPESLEPVAQSLRNIFDTFGEEIDKDRLNTILEEVFKQIQLDAPINDIKNSINELKTALNAPTDDLAALDIALKKATDQVGMLLPEMIPDALDIRAQRSKDQGRFAYGDSRALQASTETRIGSIAEYLGGNKFPGIGLLEKVSPKLAQNLGKATEAAGGFIAVLGGASMLLGSRLPDIYTNIDKLAGTTLSASTEMAGFAEALNRAGGDAIGFAKLAQQAGMGPIGVAASATAGLAFGGAQGYIEGSIAKELEISNKKIATSEANLSQLLEQIDKPGIDRGRFNELRTEIIKEYASINKEIGDIGKNTAEETRTWLLNLATAAKEAAIAFVTAQAILAGLSLAKKAVGASRGGKINYYNNGGNVFEPKGTDTVPAMLTPGEFVVNKKATSKNLSLLKAINDGTYMAEGGMVNAVLSGAGQGMYQAFVPPNVPITVVVKSLATSDREANRPSTGYFGTLSDTFNPFDADFYRTTGRTEDEIYRLGSRVAGVAAIFSTLALGATGLAAAIPTITAAASGVAPTGGAVVGEAVAGAGATVAKAGGIAGLLAGIGKLTKGFFTLTGLVSAAAGAVAFFRSIMSSSAQNEKQRQNLLRSALADQAVQYAPQELANVTLKELQNRLTQGSALKGIERQQFFLEKSGILESAQRIKLEEAGLRNQAGLTIGETPESSINEFVKSLDAARATQAQAIMESTKLEVVLQKYVSQQKSIFSRAGTPDSETKITEEMGKIDANIKAQNLTLDKIINAINTGDTSTVAPEVQNAVKSGLLGLSIPGETTLKQAEADRLANVTKVQVDTLQSALNRFEVSINKASDVFEQASRDRELLIGTKLGGKATISRASNENLNILRNLSASNNEEIAKAINNIGGGLGFSKELTDFFRQRVLTEKILTQDLPNILAKSIARNATLGARAPEDEVDTAFIQNEVINALKDVVGKDFADSIARKISNLVTKPSRSGGPLATAKDLIEDQKALKNVIDQVVALSPALVKAEEARIKTLNDVNQRLQEYADALVNITNLEIQAGKIRTEAAISIDKALNKNLSLDTLFKPFENEILKLTNIPNIAREPGARVGAQGTLDPLEIRQRLDIADELRATIQKQLDEAATIPDQQKRENEVGTLTTKLGKVTAEGEKLRLALNKLATNSERAALALNRIQELRQAQQGGRNVLSDIFKNVNNPEWQMDFINSIGAYSRALTGNIQEFELPQAIAGLEKAISVVTPQRGEELTKQFFDTVLTKLGRDNPDLANTLDFLKNQLGFAQGGENPEIEAEVARAKMLFEEQAKATDQLKERMQSGSDILLKNVQDSAQVWITAVRNSAAILQEAIKPKEFEIQNPPRRPEPPEAAGNARGGLIYASEGQYVNFKPKGTDTVPAMLTPGEFVVNARATKKNLGLLQSMNNGSVIYRAEGSDRPEGKSNTTGAFLSNTGSISFYDKVLGIQPSTRATDSSTGPYRLMYGPRDKYSFGWGPDTIDPDAILGMNMEYEPGFGKDEIVKSYWKKSLIMASKNINDRLKTGTSVDGSPLAGFDTVNYEKSVDSLPSIADDTDKAIGYKYLQSRNDLQKYLTPGDQARNNKLIAKNSRNWSWTEGRDWSDYFGIPENEVERSALGYGLTSKIIPGILGVIGGGVGFATGAPLGPGAIGTAALGGYAGMKLGEEINSVLYETLFPSWLKTDIEKKQIENPQNYAAGQWIGFASELAGGIKYGPVIEQATKGGIRKVLLSYGDEMNAALYSQMSHEELALAAKRLKAQSEQTIRKGVAESEKVTGIHGTGNVRSFEKPGVSMNEVIDPKYSKSPGYGPDMDPVNPGQLGMHGHNLSIDGAMDAINYAQKDFQKIVHEVIQHKAGYSELQEALDNSGFILSDINLGVMDNNIVRMMKTVSQEKPDLFRKLVEYLDDKGEMDILSTLGDGVDTQWFDVLNKLRSSFRHPDIDIAQAQFREVLESIGIFGTKATAFEIRGAAASGKAVMGESLATITNKIFENSRALRLKDLIEFKTSFFENARQMGVLINEAGKTSLIEAGKHATEDPQNHYRGGLIYASKGQYVNYQPKGTDTVPAMLTPGEFVVNKKATQKNLGLLKQINSGSKAYSSGGVVYASDGGSILDQLSTVRTRDGEIGAIEFDKATKELIDFIKRSSSSRDDDMLEEIFNSDFDGINNILKEIIDKQTPISNRITQRNLYLDRILARRPELMQEFKDQQDAIDANNAQNVANFEQAAQPQNQIANVTASGAGPGDYATSIPESRYYDELTYKEYLAKVKDFYLAKLFENQNVGALPAPNKDQFITDALYTQGNIIRMKPNGEREAVKGSRRRITKFDERNTSGAVGNQGELGEAGNTERWVEDENLFPGQGVQQLTPQEKAEIQQTMQQSSDTLFKSTNNAYNIHKFIQKQISNGKSVEKNDISSLDWELDNALMSLKQVSDNTRLSKSGEKLFIDQLNKKINLSDIISKLNEAKSTYINEGILTGKGGELDFSILDEFSSKYANITRGPGGAFGKATPNFVEQRKIARGREVKGDSLDLGWHGDLGDLRRDEKVVRRTSAETQFKNSVLHYRNQAGDFNNRVQKYQKKQAYLQAQEQRRSRLGSRAMSNGGLVYASQGQLIPYSPRGTDTVPAMLTPGEFVINRKATQNNLPLLRSINNGQNPEYLQTGGVTGSLTGNGGGGRGGVLDYDSLNSVFSNFSQSVDRLKSVLDSFADTGNKLSSAFGQLNSIDSASAKLSVAAVSINTASSNFNSTINGLNTSLRSLEKAISRIPSDISLNVNGSIPINVTVEVNGSQNIQNDLPQFRDAMFNEIENALRNAMPGINLNIRR